MDWFIHCMFIRRFFVETGREREEEREREREREREKKIGWRFVYKWYVNTQNLCGYTKFT